MTKQQEKRLDHLIDKVIGGTITADERAEANELLNAWEMCKGRIKQND